MPALVCMTHTQFAVYIINRTKATGSSFHLTQRPANRKTANPSLHQRKN